MKIHELAESLNLELISGAKGLNREVTGAYVSDLLSDVMGHAGEGEIWITLQTHRNVIAIASLKDLSGVILVKNNMPDADSIEASDKENIPLFSSKYSTFELSGLIYNLLLDQQKKNEILQS